MLDVVRSGSGDGITMARQVASVTGCSNHVNYGVLIGKEVYFPARVSLSDKVSRALARGLCSASAHGKQVDSGYIRFGEKAIHRLLL